MLQNNNITSQIIEQNDKENYIANMLVKTLYSNNVTQSEIQHIINLFEEKIGIKANNVLNCTTSSDYPEVIKRRMTIA